MTSDKSIQKTTLSLDRLDGGEAVFSGENKEELTLPVKMLPKGIEIGERVVLSICSEKADTLFQQRAAKDILNEILDI